MARSNNNCNVISVLLEENNYPTWLYQMHYHLKSHGLLKIVDETLLCPPPCPINPDGTEDAPLPGRYGTGSSKCMLLSLRHMLCSLRLSYKIFKKEVPGADLRILPHPDPQYLPDSQPFPGSWYRDETESEIELEQKALPLSQFSAMVAQNQNASMPSVPSFGNNIFNTAIPWAANCAAPPNFNASNASVWLS
ncbi:hypothetical protein ACLB2K_006161 [Fragaria x ananassa]